MLTALAGWESLPALKKLHLRRNKISKIDEEGLPPLPELVYLNLRKNAFDDLTIVMRVLNPELCPNIKDINILNNPCDINCSSINILIAEFLTKKPALERVCKRKIMESNKLEAVHLAHYRWDKSEEERKAKEAAEAAKGDDE